MLATPSPTSSCRAPSISATSRCGARCRRRARAWSGRSSSSTISGRPNSAPGNGLDVRPHPHIGLATVTYLFDGEIMHRDSLGTAVADPAGRGQLDDRRPRHRAFRAHRRRERAPPAAADPRPADVGGAARRARGDGRRALRITPPTNFRWSGTTARRCAWWSARSTARARRCRPCMRRMFADVHLKAGSSDAARRRPRGARDLCDRRRDRHRRRQIRGRPAAGVQARRPGVA